MALATLRSREIVVIILAFCGLAVLADYFVRIPVLRTAVDELKVWAVLIAAFATGVGFFGYARRTIIKTRAREPGWPVLIYGVILAIVMSYFGIFYGVEGTGYSWLFNYVLQSVRTATVALGTPFIFSAALRAFRARNLDAVLFLIAGVLLMLYNAPIGEVIWSGFPVVGQWILDVPQTSVNRALMILTGLGLAAYGIRYIVGFEEMAAER